MNTELEQRKKELSRQLAQAQAMAQKEADAIRALPRYTPEDILAHLRGYILAKLLLPADCEEDELKTLIVLSLKRTMELDKKLLKELDTAAPCNNVSSIAAKKILLLYAVTKDIIPGADAAALVAKTRVSEMAEMVYEVLLSRVGGSSPTP